MEAPGVISLFSEKKWCSRGGHWSSTWFQERSAKLKETQRRLTGACAGRVQGKTPATRPASTRGKGPHCAPAPLQREGHPMGYTTLSTRALGPSPLAALPE